ncbi:MAG: glucose-1-phosphate adenylyltransferase [Burkholderiales bacterium]|nr:glucose-1-phosphate adenylyltransferase [Burkholderiales bacterium]
MKAPKILAFVMAGGEGSRLHPLTAERSKPAVPFGGRYRIVDFVLSSLVNSGIQSIYMLVQYKSQSLIEHINQAWVISSPIIPDQFITVVPPQMREGPGWFQGTADAVCQNLNLIERHSPDLVAVFGADHIYRMDVQKMVDFHLEHGAELTVSARQVPLADASSLGVIAADRDGRILSFDEKPECPTPSPADPQRAYCSMGNYLFNTDLLVESLLKAKEEGKHDFGRHIIPDLIHRRRVYAYDFTTNVIPGVKSYEEPAYWRDVGTIDSYFAANMDMLGLEPRFNMFNPKWPIATKGYPGPAPKIVEGEIHNSILGAGTLVKGAKLTNSILRRELVLERDVEIEDSIIMDYTQIRHGVRLKRVIIDRYNTIEAGTQIGYDLEADRKRYHVTDSGIVVVTKGRHCVDDTHYY